MRPAGNFVLILLSKDADLDIKIRCKKFPVGGQRSTACDAVPAGPKPGKKIKPRSKWRGLFRRIGRWFEKRPFWKEVFAIAIGDLLAVLILAVLTHVIWVMLIGFVQAVIGQIS
jgi:hypothetical protein